MAQFMDAPDIVVQFNHAPLLDDSGMVLAMGAPRVGTITVSPKLAHRYPPGTQVFTYERDGWTVQATITGRIDHQATGTVELEVEDIRSSRREPRPCPHCGGSGLML